MTSATGQLSIGFCRSSCSEARAAAKAHPLSIICERAQDAALARALRLAG